MDIIGALEQYQKEMKEFSEGMIFYPNGTIRTGKMPILDIEAIKQELQTKWKRQMSLDALRTKVLSECALKGMSAALKGAMVYGTGAVSIDFDLAKDADFTVTHVDYANMYALGEPKEIAEKDIPAELRSQMDARAKMTRMVIEQGMIARMYGKEPESPPEDVMSMTRKFLR